MTCTEALREPCITNVGANLNAVHPEGHRGENIFVPEDEEED
jgi:hypothetical protein